MMAESFIRQPLSLTCLTWSLPPHSPAGTFAHRLLSPTTSPLAVFPRQVLLLGRTMISTALGALRGSLGLRLTSTFNHSTCHVLLYVSKRILSTKKETVSTTVSPRTGQWPGTYRISRIYTPSQSASLLPYHHNCRHQYLRAGT